MSDDIYTSKQSYGSQRTKLYNTCLWQAVLSLEYPIVSWNHITKVQYKQLSS